MRSTMARMGFSVASAASEMGMNQEVERGWEEASMYWEVAEVEEIVMAGGGGVVMEVEGRVEVERVSTARCLMLAGAVRPSFVLAASALSTLPSSSVTPAGMAEQCDEEWPARDGGDREKSLLGKSADQRQM